MTFNFDNFSMASALLMSFPSLSYFNNFKNIFYMIDLLKLKQGIYKASQLLRNYCA